eukprot:2153657-Alexandrium_andersonii.AAC.1
MCASTARTREPISTSLRLEAYRCRPGHRLVKPHGDANTLLPRPRALRQHSQLAVADHACATHEQRAQHAVSHQTLP